MSNTIFAARNAIETDWKDIKKLYYKSFPPFEQKPFFMIKGKVDEGKSDMIVFTSNGVFVGFASTLIYKDLVLIDYFAICEDMRGKGFGSKALNKIFEMYNGKKIMLTAEELNPKSKNSKQREKRLKFYFANGLKDNDFYSKAFIGMSFRVLTFPEKVTENEFLSIHYNVMGNFFTRIAGICTAKKRI